MGFDSYRISHLAQAAQILGNEFTYLIAG